MKKTEYLSIVHRPWTMVMMLFLSLWAFSFQLSAAYADDIAAAERPFLAGDYEKAARESSRLIDSGSGKKDELYYLKGLSQLKLNRFADARDSFGKVVSGYPKSGRAFDAHVGIGDSYFLEGNRGAAESIYNDILNKFSNDRNIEIVRARVANCKASVVPAPAPSPAPIEMARGDTGKYISIQVGSFKSKRNADNLSRKLDREGYDSYVEMPVSPGDKMYRVKIGRYRSREEAARLAAKLKVRGYPTRICEQ